MGQSLFGDELFTYGDLAGRSLGGVVHHVAYGGVEDNPPLFYVLAHLSAQLGDARVWLRLPSVLLGAATVPVLYAAGRLAVGERAALWGAALWTLSPFVLFYGTEGRAYATMAFLVALSMLAVLRRWWVLYALAACAAMYAHYTAVFALAAQAGWVWLARPADRRALLIASAAAVVAFLPWIPALRAQQGDSSVNVISAFYPLTPRSVAEALGRQLCCHPYLRPRDLPGPAGLVLLAVGAVVVVAGNVWLWRRRRPADEPSGRWLVLAVAVATPLGLLLYSAVGTGIFAPRNLTASIPALCLLLGWLIARLPARLAVAGGGLVAAGLLAGIVVGLAPSKQRPDVAGAAAYIDAHAGPGDAYLEAPLYFSSAPDLEAALRINFDRPHRVAGQVSFRREGGRLRAVADRDVWRARRVFVVGPELPNAVGLPRPPPGAARRVAARRFPGIFPIDVLVYAGNG